MNGGNFFGLAANITGYTRPSFSVNPEITATPNDNGTYTLTLTKDPVIDWKGFANTDAFWTIDFFYFENVDKIKIESYILYMKFTVEKLSQAQDEIDSLEQFQKDMLESDYSIIQNQGIEFVRVKPIQKDIFEIKTNELRSLFKYSAGKIIVIGVVFVKKTKKTPKEKIKLAKQRLKEV